MAHVIFYSWQGDYPSKTNRGFIKTALDEAVAALATDLTVEPRIDQDTQNVPGSPDIAQTIFRKIEQSDVFVADVTLINPASAERRTPNPNVLLELGYALHALGPDRIILVMNTTYGPIKDLPFDLKMRRVIPYDMPDEAERAPERQRLAAILKTAIKTAIDAIPQPSPSLTNIDASITGIETAAPNRALLVRRAMQEITTALERTAPPLFRFGGTDEQLVNAIGETVPAVREFTRLAETVASLNDEEATRALYKSFTTVFEHYHNPRGFTGTSDRRDFDHWKFLGHELLVTLIAKLLHEERYELTGTILEETVTINNPSSGRGNTPVNYDFGSEYLEGLEKLTKLKQRMSLHADLLHDRHDTGGPLHDVLPFEQFLAADYFLFLRGELTPDEEPSGFLTWCPWSSVYLRDTPDFLHNATRSKTAERLANALGLPDVATLKQRLPRTVRLTRLWQSGRWEQPFGQDDIDRIATR